MAMLGKLFLRYTMLCWVIFEGILAMPSHQLTSMVIVLCYVINNQWRYFYLHHVVKLWQASLLLEWGLYGYLIYAYGVHPVCGLLIGVWDIFERGKKIDDFLLLLIPLALVFFFGIGRISVSEWWMITIIAVLFYLFRNQRQAIYRLEKELKAYATDAKNLRQSNQELESSKQSVRELTLLRERNRLSREIHDTVGHRLSTIVIQLSAIGVMAKSDGEKASEMAHDLREFSRLGLEDIRGALRAMKPENYENYEILMLIDELSKEFQQMTGIVVSLRYSEKRHPLADRYLQTLYRVSQEFMSNSARHGKAKKIDMYLHFDESGLIYSLKDDGVGAEVINRGMGLTGMEERVRECGGQVSWNTSPGKGFWMRVTLPKEA